MARDPWNFVGVPLYWGLLGVVVARETVMRLNSRLRGPKPSAGTETVKVD